MFRMCVVLAAFAVASCDSKDVALCEEYVKSSLLAPSTYKRFNVETESRTVSIEEYRTERGDNLTSKLSDLDQLQFKIGKLGIRTVVVEYDAANGAGTVVRQRGLCKFPLRDGELPSDIELQSSMRQALREKRIDAVVDSGAIGGITKNFKAAEPSCCL